MRGLRTNSIPLQVSPRKDEAYNIMTTPSLFSGTPMIISSVPVLLHGQEIEEKSELQKFTHHDGSEGEVRTEKRSTYGYSAALSFGERRSH
jgi:hypothetical protein